MRRISWAKEKSGSGDGFSLRTAVNPGDDEPISNINVTILLLFFTKSSIIKGEERR